jgi:hypothetical protein
MRIVDSNENGYTVKAQLQAQALHIYNSREEKIVLYTAYVEESKRAINDQTAEKYE